MEAQPDNSAGCSVLCQAPRGAPNPSFCHPSPWGTHPGPSKGMGDIPRMLCPEHPKIGQCLHLSVLGDTWGHQARPPPFISAVCWEVGREGRSAGCDRSIN